MRAATTTLGASLRVLGLVDRLHDRALDLQAESRARLSQLLPLQRLPLDDR